MVIWYENGKEESKYEIEEDEHYLEDTLAAGSVGGGGYGSDRSVEHRGGAADGVDILLRLQFQLTNGVVELGLR